MPRAGEYTYLSSISEEALARGLNKPFSPEERARQFLDLGAIYSLLPPAPARILDAGCGAGWLSRFIARAGYSVLGMDCSSEAIELARGYEHFANEGDVTFEVGDFEQCDFTEEFDAIIFYAALHHTQDLEASLHCAYKALKTGGIMLAIEPGAGHGELADEHATKYDLGDRDMPPKLIKQVAKQIGFSEFHCYQHSGQLHSCLYGGQPNSEKLRKLWHIPGVRYLALVASMLYLKRNNGTVKLVK